MVSGNRLMGILSAPVSVVVALILLLKAHMSHSNEAALAAYGVMPPTTAGTRT